MVLPRERCMTMCREWLGRPYALNPQESEHMSDARLDGFSRIMEL